MVFLTTLVLSVVGLQMVERVDPRGYSIFCTCSRICSIYLQVHRGLGCARR